MGNYCDEIQALSINSVVSRSNVDLIVVAIISTPCDLLIVNLRKEIVVFVVDELGHRGAVRASVRVTLIG